MIYDDLNIEIYRNNSLIRNLKSAIKQFIV